ncbi:hypothetical protein [Couchioplanes azureus]|uniref:hypothetical protein n=1 Tax=Couchioplanes caeruleus TaxID=56438 RepID=UPI00167095C9|nr:hypothetical protein [Couchioplanes caeruleus]GGQ65118.1 hypothetical protein GCM10010166_38420 [Couchioplanes caeruleus subsp. azureus]
MTAPRPPRWFSAEDIVHGRVSLAGYPFRYIWINATPSSGFRVTVASGSTVAAMVDMVFTAAEMLEAEGWQVVNFEQEGKVAYLRRPD